MTAFRFFLIIVVFCVVSVGWMILGATLEYRTHDLTQRLGEEVDTMWGPSGLVQQAPAPPVAPGAAVRRAPPAPPVASPAAAPPTETDASA